MVVSSFSFKIDDIDVKLKEKHYEMDNDCTLLSKDVFACMENVGGRCKEEDMCVHA
jgi:hypothetical protein